jgi:protoporphyrinogen oxidase
MAEVSVSDEKEVDVESIAPSTIDFLCHVGVLESPADIVWRSHVDVKYAYPVYTHARPGLVGAIQEWMGRHDIFSVGRFGEWEYINSDKCVQKGLDLGRALRERYPAATTRTEAG